MSQNWDRVQSLFLEALDLSPAERGAFLDVACAGDIQLRAEVESLLANDSSDERRIAEALEDTAHSLFQSENLQGARLGAWRVTKEIGRGGMGTVYLACRDDDQFRKHVAIKVVAHGVDTAEMLNRFRHERQILAHLDHPFIARLIDGGNTPQGSPFLVMEYVEGRPIDAYCNEQKLDVASQLRLFLKVCDAVSYAHRNLIIHRDLKPGNILVTSDGSPKLLDFGIAKVLDEISGGTAEHATRVLTPEYGSPEQARGEAVTTATDVYSLGGVLYRVLTGVAPHAVHDTSPLAIMCAIIEEDVRKPSDLRHGLSADIDSILLKALHREPQRRYRSVDQFAGDIERLLQGRPVTARPDTVLYRAGKYVRRHVLAMAMGTAIVVLLAGFAVLQTIQLRKTRAERDRANRITDFMTGMFKVPDPNESRGRKVTAREILDNASQNVTSGLSSDPELQADLKFSMAGTYTGLGLYSQAQRLAESALEIRRRVLGDRNRETLESQNQVAWLLDREDHYGEAETLIRQTISTDQHVLGADDPLTLDAMSRLSGILQDMGRFQDEEQLQRQAVELCARRLGPDNPRTLKAEALLASSISFQGRNAEAESIYRKVLGDEQRILGADAPDTLVTMRSLANTIKDQARYAEAEDLYRQTLTGEQRVLGPEHPVTTDTMVALAYDLAHGAGRVREAESLYRQAFEIERRVLGPESRITLRAQEGLAIVLLVDRQYAEAERLQRDILAIRQRELGPKHTDVLLSKYNLATVLRRSGQRVAAEKLLRETLDEQTRFLGKEHADTLATKAYLADLLNDEGRWPEAEELAREAFEVQLRVLGPQDMDTISSLQGLAIALVHNKHYSQAKQMYATEIQQVSKADSASISAVWYGFACVAASANDRGPAVQYLRKAFETGYVDGQQVRNDTTLKSLHGDPGFETLLTTEEEKAKRDVSVAR
jgi:serine/threonine protein kinase/tetratricopeptide (TPR) repeat protein